MEHVRGVPLGEYCDRHRLTLKERLELFLQVCCGVEHAHGRGIIHRDLKSSKILVGTPACASLIREDKTGSILFLGLVLVRWKSTSRVSD